MKERRRRNNDGCESANVGGARRGASADVGGARRGASANVGGTRIAFEITFEIFETSLL